MSPLEAYQRFGAGRRAIVFATRCEHAKALAADLRDGGVLAGHVDGEMPSRDRDAVLAQWRAGALRVVVNVGVLVEGFDDPEVAVCIHARRFRPTGAFLQATGRVLRPYPGKEHATLIDLCGSVLEHGLPDLPRTYSLDGRAISRPDKLSIRQCGTCGRVFAAGPTLCPGCGAVLAAVRRKAARSGRGDVHELNAERMRSVLRSNLEAAARERGLSPDVAERAAQELELRRSA
jgi:superfamily II DNA or RNA helicase